MRILIVSWYFPPASTMGALCVGKLAKHLIANGHDVRVVCGRDLPFSQTLPLEVPADRVHYARWLDVNAPPRAAAKLKGLLVGSTAAPTTDAAPKSAGDAGTGSRDGLLRRISHLYMRCLNRPDAYIGWYPFALAAGSRTLNGWRPEIVFASAPPFTTLLVVRRLARRFSIPLVAEYRDRWIEDPYTDYSRLELALDRRCEDGVLRDVCGLVTVSEPWAEDYRQRTGKPVAVVYNGFDLDDFPESGSSPDTNRDRLEIVYTGIIYPERRDPTPLFQALKRLGSKADQIRVKFFGATPHLVAASVAECDVEAHVEVNGVVPYRQALDVQAKADVLLLMQWNDPKERGNCPGKLFEYIASRRPTLALGPPDGVPAKILRERNAGVLVNEPDAIAARLESWLAEKQAKGMIPLLPLDSRAGLSRPEQFAKPEQFFADRLRAQA